MRVVLLHNVPKLGKKYDIKEVARGYGLNFLIPQGFAEVATDSAVRRVEKLQAQELAKKKIREDLLLKNFKDLENVTIKLTEKANEQGHLFAGVHVPEIIAAVKEQTRLEMDADHIDLPEAIKSVGEHRVPIKVGDKEAIFTVVIEAK